MRFGLFSLFSQPNMSIPQKDVYRNAFDLCERADQAGFDCLWVAEHPFTHQGNKNFFRIIVNDALAGPETVKYAVNKLGKKKLGIIYENTDYGKGLVDASEPVVQQLGAEIVASETYTMGADKDFSAQLTKIKAAQPEVLIHYGNYGEGGPIMGQAAKIGLNVPKLIEGGDQDQQFIELAGKDAVEGTTLFSTWDPNSQVPSAKGFEAKYKAKTGQDSLSGRLTTTTSCT